mmetsp:Transcript_11828/g.23996  ORF Transcript_11828/g.23996 Transcript_11828/m.23996 type:complete len:113 (-) Transcript_11828:95-433(-)
MSVREEVKRRGSRRDLRAEFGAPPAEIERVKRKRGELEALGEERNQRAQLLREAVAELKQDLQREQKLGGEVVGSAGAGGASTGATSRPAGDKASQQAGSQSGAGADVEVIS